MKEYFQTLARYNRWANIRLYDACGKLPENEYLLDRKAFFHSIHGTLNHLLVCDRLWLGRLKFRESGITSLDQMLYADFKSLWSARQAEDERIIELIDGMTESALNGLLKFKTLAGKESAMGLRWLLGHLFNHHTHHRGQVHAMLSQAGSEPPALDIYYFMG
ncbi:hypothetical protein AQUSIP_19370 [Aquicella siphonis]|uniref:DinB family protein n=1 Tax=Aquicella siphonis TaxID=254247 RepID=A0A5E4PI52_9COXI|nr:DinB family protein [Aquicella siphonis]VVC76614.1 hypothetical protein AQUSIP_19370 [Aquicella siphonis]